MHIINAAERAIRTWNHNFVSGISGTDKVLSMYLWEKLLEQAEITLNMLRPDISNPNISANKTIKGKLDFGTARHHGHSSCKPNIRRTWGHNGVQGCYTGPSVEPY